MEPHLKQRLLGAIVLVSMAVIFLPILFDGDGYRQLSNFEFNIPEQPRISFDQNFRELGISDSEIVVTREQVDINNFSSKKFWFVHIDDKSNMDSATNLVRRLTDLDYNASYRMISKEGKTWFKVEVRVGDKEVDAQNIARQIKKEYGFSTSIVQR